MKNKNEMQNCPCCSGNKYEDCCKPFHEGTLPSTALQLMRSRYCAYSLNLSTYIIKTTHPKNLQYNANHKEWGKQISNFSLNTEFKKLEILQFEENNLLATVTFKAYLSQNNKDVSFTEKSLFEKVDGMWLYLMGQVN
jgi:SEC-C motif-containing protein